MPAVTGGLTKEFFMKKTKKIFETLSVFLMSAALFSFAACDNGSDSTSGEASDTDTLTFESIDDAAFRSEGGASVRRSLLASAD